MWFPNSVEIMRHIWVFKIRKPPKIHLSRNSFREIEMIPPHLFYKREKEKKVSTFLQAQTQSGHFMEPLETIQPLVASIASYNCMVQARLAWILVFELGVVKV